MRGNLTTEIINSFIKGDQAAFQAIYDAYRDYIYMRCFRKLQHTGEAEDIVLETFESLWKYRHSIKDAEHLRAFLYRVANARSIDALRRRKTLLPDSASSLLAEETMDIAGHEFLIDVLIKAILDKAADLPPQCKKVFIYHISGRTADEISSILKISKRAVYVHCTKAKHEIRKSLKKEGVHPSMHF